MESQALTLTPADLRRFERDGYIAVRQAFPRTDALAMEDRWWLELADTRGISRDDRSSWRNVPGNLKAAKRDPIQASMLTETVSGAFDDLLGAGTWSWPRDWGVTLVTFPEPGGWEPPTRLWHWDNPTRPAHSCAASWPDLPELAQASGHHGCCGRWLRANTGGSLASHAGASPVNPATPGR